MAIEYKTLTYRTCDSANDDASYNWVELSTAHIPAVTGKIKRISIAGAHSTSTAGMTTDPVYLGLWERQDDGGLISLGCSKNAIVQGINQDNIWEFDGALLRGRSLLISLLSAPGDPWNNNTPFLLRSRVQTEDSDGCVILTNIGRFYVTPDITFTVEYEVQIPDEEPEQDTNIELREIDVSDYMPPVVRDTDEFKQIAAAENPEFNELQKRIAHIKLDSFVETATEYGVSRWESILNITPVSGDTLEARKTRILTYLNMHRPYTWRVLKQMLVPILGGEDKFVMDYVNDMGKLLLHTDRIDESTLASITALLERVLPQNIEVEQYNHHIEVSWRDINKYAECETYADMVAVNPDFANDLTSDGEWVYPIPKLKYLNQYHEDASKHSDGFWRGNNRIKKWSVELPAVREAGSGFRNSSIEVFDGGFPALKCPTYQYYASKIYAEGEFIFTDAVKLRYFRGDLSKACRLNWAFSGCTRLTEFHATLDSLCTAANAFNYCQLDKASTLRILNSLPSKEYVDSVYTDSTAARQKLTLGMHTDLQHDDEVLAAIAAAESKGWTLEKQWNGKPTSGVSTMDLEEVWCRIVESEYGEYADENGIRCSLCWGHDVTDTTGYMLFFSLVEAEQYYKLTRVNNHD